MKKYFLDERAITFLISLLIAFGMWLLIKLSGDFQIDHNIKLNFQNLPIDKILVNKPDSTLQIRTNNNGFDVIGQFLFNNKKVLNIDFSKAKYLNTKKGKQTYFILSSSLRHGIEEAFITAEQILQVEPDSIVFTFEKKASKKIKIEPQLKLTFNPRFKPYHKMILEPDSIVFYGSASTLKSLTSINTKIFKLENISSNIDTVIPLNLPNNKLSGKPDKIRLKLTVEEYTEGKIKLPIQLKGDAKTNYKIFPEEAFITYQVALKDYSNINSSAFELHGIPDPNESGKILLQLRKQPQNIIVSNIQPATAEYIIIK